MHATTPAALLAAAPAARPGGGRARVSGTIGAGARTIARRASCLSNAVSLSLHHWHRPGREAHRCCRRQTHWRRRRPAGRRRRQVSATRCCNEGAYLCCPKLLSACCFLCQRCATRRCEPQRPDVLLGPRQHYRSVELPLLFDFRGSSAHWGALFCPRHHGSCVGGVGG